MNQSPQLNRIHQFTNIYPATNEILNRCINSEWNQEVLCLSTNADDFQPTSVLLYPGIKENIQDEIDSWSELPDFYQNFLSTCNGINIFSLYFLGYSELLPTLKCRDIGSANRLWQDFDVPEYYLLLGGRNFSWDETVRYYYDQKSKCLLSVLINGDVIKEWNSIDELFQIEIPIAEQLEIENKKRLYEIRQNALREASKRR